MEFKGTKDLEYYKNNCNEDYLHTPISVLRYISELEKVTESAPDLLKALIGLVNQIENEHCSEYIDDLQENAKRAINKALNK